MRSFFIGGLAFLMTSSAWAEPSQKMEGKFLSAPAFMPEIINGKETLLKVEEISFKAYDVHEYFESQGVEFPPGSKALALADTGVFFFQNTADNMEIIENLLSDVDHSVRNSMRARLSLVSLPPDSFKASDTSLSYEKFAHRFQGEWKIVNTVEALMKGGEKANIFPSSKPSDHSEQATASFETTIGLDAITIQTEISYQFSEAADNKTPFQFEYTGSVIGTLGKPQLVKVKRDTNSPTYVLILKVDWVPIGKLVP